MVSIFIKIIIAAILLVFLDILFSTLLGDFVTIRGEEFTLLTLLLRIFELLAAFLVLIIHAVTHLFQWNVFMDDIGLLIDGLVSVFLWLIGGFFELLFKILQFPFELLFGFLLKDFPSGIWIDIPLLLEIIIDLRTLTFQFSIPNLTEADNFQITIVSETIQFVAKNTVGISIFGLDHGVNLMYFGADSVGGFLGGDLSVGSLKKWGSIYAHFPKDHLSITLDLETGFILITEIKVVIPFLDIVLVDIKEEAPFILSLPKEIEHFSLMAIFNNIIGELPFPTPVEWIANVYSAVTPAGVGGGASLLNQIIEYDKVKKWQINRIV